MATIQQAAAANQHPGAPMTIMSKQQVDDALRRLKSMRDQGVPTTDPEFIRISQYLRMCQQETNKRRVQQAQHQAHAQAQAQQQQQHLGQPQQQIQQSYHGQQSQPQPQQQQHLQLTQAQAQALVHAQLQAQVHAQAQLSQPAPQIQTAANGSSTGLQHTRGLQQPSDPGPSLTTGAALAPLSTQSTSGYINAQSPQDVGTVELSQEQAMLLKQQIVAFKSLGKNGTVPSYIQQALLAHRHRRQLATLDQAARDAARDAISPAASSTVATSVAMPSAAQADVMPQSENAVDQMSTDDQDQTASPHDTKTHGSTPFQDPYKLVPNIAYAHHANRKNRWFIPSIFPTGINFDNLRYERELILHKRMSDRYEELKSLPGNISHWDSSQEELGFDDSIRLKAIIELKKLGLYAKQRALRDKVGKQMMHYDNLAMTTNRSNYRRPKKLNVREARITEKLEKQQRDARENREKKKHRDFLNAIHIHWADIYEFATNVRAKGQKLSRTMYAQHFNIEKEEQKRVERTAKQRLQALKANDEEAYLKLLDQAKDTRITHLLRQTDGFLHQLAASVKAQQRQAARRYGDELGQLATADEEESDPADGAENETGDGSQVNRKIDYYAVAHRIKEEVTEQANMLVGGRLKEYQVKGLQWMLSLYNNNLNGILADEMGLGKTIQTISLITYLVERKHQNGPYLVIVPLSTLTNWNLEFEKWAPSISRIEYKGPPITRKLQQDKLRQGRFQVLLTTYEYVIKDRPVLSKIKWFHMIIDEGHRMKNTNSKLSATISQYYNTRFRLILTGTPLQNNLGELWAMLNFVLPNIFKSAKTFDEWFNTPFANTGGQDKMELTEEEQILVIRRLHKVLRPFLLRRLKKDVEKDLPDKTEKVIKCQFSALQAKLYKQMVTHNKLVVSDGKGGKTGARGLSNMIMQLRKLCNHPFVFEEVENVLNPMSVSNDLLWRTAGKFELLDRILPKYKATGHRILMFFQMTAIMNIMEDFLRYRRYDYLRLDGTTKADERSDLLRDFNQPGSPYFIFLLSTRAGGLGLNLQTADTVIIYDSDWNPHQDLQAQDRAHRIGQKNEVRILRLISSNSVEEKILERARYKLNMDGKVIQAGRFDNKSSETDRDAMLRTLLETADLAESGESEEMDDEELNMILARSDNELVVFQQLDEEQMRDRTYGTGPGCRAVPRLMGEDELPEMYLSDGMPVCEEEEEVLGRGARERTRVRYDDGLTEEQWLMAVDDEEDSPEAAAARKQARKDKREANRSKQPSGHDSVDNSSVASRASTEEVETPRRRGRKSGTKAEKRKVDDIGATDDEPPVKKRRGASGRPRLVEYGSGSGSVGSGVGGGVGGGGGGDRSRMTAYGMRDLLQRSLRALYDGLMTLEADDEPDPGQDEDEDELEKRLIIGPFIRLPPKRDWANYYLVIQNPICMKMMETRMKKDEYSCLGDFKRDIDLMIRNCRTFNEDGSLLYKDAAAIEDYFNAKMHDIFDQHPELRELEMYPEGDGTTPLSGMNGAPHASAAGTRIRLMASAGGGGSSRDVTGAMHSANSDDES